MYKLLGYYEYRRYNTETLQNTIVFPINLRMFPILGNCGV